MRELRYTLVTDGSSDKALIPILTWLLREHHITCAIQAEWADLGRLGKRPKDLADKVKWSLDLYPCDLLFIHRDAEKASPQVRIEEIHAALEKIKNEAKWSRDLTVCVVPIRMREAWFFFNELALRMAAGNPNGQQPLDLPQVKGLEQLPDPKSLLHQLLRQASGLRGRRLKHFAVDARVLRIADFIDDFSPLRALPAFNALEQEVKRAVNEQGWIR
jgi:hypothetical protein